MRSRQLREELQRVNGDFDLRLKDIESGGRPVITGGNTIYNTGDLNVDDRPVAVAVGQNDTNVSASGQGVGNQTLGTLNQSAETGAVSSEDGAARDYEDAYSFIKARDFDKAESAFGEFIQKYPDDVLISNAKYWYGETFYVRGNYDKAARIFAEGYQKYPKGPKAASNLLKLGMALKGMGKTDDACIAFKQLQKDYASAAVPVLKRAETEMERIDCR